MSREIHKETATTVGTGLMINYPLNVFLLFLFIDVFAWNNTFLIGTVVTGIITCLLYTSPSPRDATLSRMPSSA